MKKFLLLALVIGFPSPLFAEELKNFYLSIGGGETFSSEAEGEALRNGTKVDSKYSLGDHSFYSVGFGKQINDWRIEFNYSATTLSADKVTATVAGTEFIASITPKHETDAKTYMLYGFKDFSNESKFTPYVGLGLGAASLDTNDVTIGFNGTDLSVDVEGTSSTIFTYALKAGADYEINESTSLFTETIYQTFSEHSVSHASESREHHASGNNYFGISAGLRFKF